MSDLTTLRSLRERVEKAGGPNRELDGRIMFTLFAKPAGDRGFLWPEDNPSWAFAFMFGQSSKKVRRGQETIEWQLDDGKWILMNSLRVPELTGSIDAIRALIRRQFPNACITINEWADHADFGFSLLRHEDDYATAGGEAATAPLAGCLALLSALISIAERRESEQGESR